MLKSLVLAAFFAGLLAFGPNCRYERKVEVPPPTDMPANLKVAFMGDAGADSNQKDVLELILRQRANFTIHMGDFEYENSPATFEANINAVLGPDYPYFGSIGNHDALTWNGNNGHQARLIARMERTGLADNCRGEYGVKMACSIQGLYFVLSGVGQREINHPEYIEEVFNGYPALWKVVNWHKNQRMYQIGGKRNEVGYEVYDAARRHGAIVSTGHEHSYCRSHLMSDFSEYQIASLDETLHLREGESFVWVSGLAGKSIRSWNSDLVANPWWASVGASNNNVQYGATFCTFNIDGVANHARCQFVTVDDQVWDDFEIYSHLTNEKVPAPKCRSPFMEIAVADASKDANLRFGRAMECHSSELSFGQSLLGDGSRLQFDNVPLNKDSKIKEIHLQIMGKDVEVEVEPKMVIRGSTEQGIQCDAQATPIRFSGSEVVWDHDEEGWESGDVWVSPDLTDIVKELISQPSWTEGDSITLQLTGKGMRSFYSFDHGACFAPTLTIELEKEC